MGELEGAERAVAAAERYGDAAACQAPLPPFPPHTPFAFFACPGPARLPFPAHPSAAAAAIRVDLRPLRRRGACPPPTHSTTTSTPSHGCPIARSVAAAAAAAAAAACQALETPPSKQG